MLSDKILVFIKFSMVLEGMRNPQKNIVRRDLVSVKPVITVITVQKINLLHCIKNNCLSNNNLFQSKRNGL